jgi:hypothetical protein
MGGERLAVVARSASREQLAATETGVIDPRCAARPRRKRNLVTAVESAQNGLDPERAARNDGAHTWLRIIVAIETMRQETSTHSHPRVTGTASASS